MVNKDAASGCENLSYFQQSEFRRRTEAWKAAFYGTPV
jgi:hypothetical protein